jgi:predicted RNase H-like HicB family nuclease
MNLNIEIDREEDGRWIAEVEDLSDVTVYGETREEAIQKVKTLALRVIADCLKNGESSPQQIESLVFNTV